MYAACKHAKYEKVVIVWREHLQIFLVQEGASHNNFTQKFKKLKLQCRSWKNKPCERLVKVEGIIE